ncbi:MAG: hypothetical protein M1819_005181 [Sarea resinae]|nr:MAG: hypothetical protein M1819_005181 [Sarea resinae]
MAPRYPRPMPCATGKDAKTTGESGQAGFTDFMDCWQQTSDSLYSAENPSKEDAKNTTSGAKYATSEAKQEDLEAFRGACEESRGRSQGASIEPRGDLGNTWDGRVRGVALMYKSRG